MRRYGIIGHTGIRRGGKIDVGGGGGIQDRCLGKI